MKSLLKHRAVLIALSAGAVLALVVLAAGVREIHFKEPLQISSNQANDIQVSFHQLFQQIVSVPMWKLILFWGIVFMIVFVIASMLSPELRKHLLNIFIRVTIFSIAILFLMKNGARLGLFDPNPPPLTSADTAVAVESVPMPVFTPPSIPPLTAYLITVAVILGTVGLFWLLGRELFQFRLQRTQGPALEEIAAAARLSLDELYNGSDWEDSIVRCYVRMAQAVARHRGISRDVDVTPAEFAHRLELAGLPAASVGRLTRLFESVRYGARSSGTRESDEAVACLTDILSACGETA